MIRPLTLLTMVAAAGAGLYLYQVKHSVAQLDRELRQINRQTELARERTQVLRAEWALLNEPERLRQVAQRHLPLEAMTPTQFVRLNEVDRRLPPPRVFAGPASLFAPADTPGDGAATALALAPSAPREGRGTAVGAAAAAPAPAASRPAPAAPPAAAVALAAAPAEARAPAPRVAPAAPPPVQRALHVEQPGQRPATQRASAPLAAPAVSSVLATGGPALAPPVPIARAAAATLGDGR